MSENRWKELLNVDDDLLKKLEEFRDQDTCTHALFENDDVFRVPINWIHIQVGKKRVGENCKPVFGAKRGRWVFFGFCMLHRRVYTVNLYEPLGLHVLIIHDLYIHNGSCEEGRRCLNEFCHFNRTTKGSFLTSKGLSPNKWSKVNWENWKSFSKLTWDQLKQCANATLFINDGKPHDH